VLQWLSGADGRGALLTGDILQVVADRRWLSFMYSYPNYLPLPAATVRRMARALEPHGFARIHGAWFDAVVPEDGKGALGRSVARYLRALDEA
jgi:hypothetical protein